MYLEVEDARKIKEMLMKFRETLKRKYVNHLNVLRDKIHKNAVGKGFYDCSYCNDKNGRYNGKDCPECKGTGKDKKNFGESLMLITSELGEALEADRKGVVADIEGYKHHCNYLNTDFDASQFAGDIKDSKEDELADALIRILDTCGYYGIDIQWHVEQKMKYNSTREVKHGKKY